MKRSIERPIFLKKSALATIGAMVFPHSPGWLESYYPGQGSRSFHPGSSDILVNVNWQEMLKNHDLIWRKVPSDMTEAPHPGNGHIGSMIWLEENKIRLQVCRTDVHDHADENFGWTAYSRPSYQIGYFLMKPEGEIIACDLRLDIRKGEEVVLYQAESVPDFIIEPLALEPNNINHFGIN
jgi:hypothetical protein